MPGDPTLAPLLWQWLGLVLLPAWLVAGAGDYAVHARTDIAHTSGVAESLLHLAQTAQVGVPLLALLFLETNALVLALLLAGVLAHTATTWIDVLYTAPRRRIPPVEHMLHGVLLVVPVAGLAIVAVLHWPAWQALLHPSTAPPGSWSVAWRSPPLPGATLAGVLGASVLLGVLPGLWELSTTLAARRARRARWRR